MWKIVSMPETLTQNSKNHCCRCSELAVWCYAPTTSRKDIYYCEEHVPRGCSCNSNLFDDDAPIGHPDQDLRVSPVDNEGRILPCVEYWFDEEGFTHDYD